MTRERAQRLLDHWDRALGDEDLTWGFLENLRPHGPLRHGRPRRRGWRGDRPWRWLNDAPALVCAEGDALTARIFLLVWWCATTMAPAQTPSGERDLGLADRDAIQTRAWRWPGSNRIGSCRTASPAR